MDENVKENEGASTSKKDIKDRKDDEVSDDREHDGRSYSDCSASYYSGQSRDVRKDENTELPKMLIGKMPPMKKRIRRGRVTKPRRTGIRRRYQPMRRTARRKPQYQNIKHERYSDAGSIFSTHSSRTDNGSRTCAYCGHRCCGRRLVREKALERKLRREYTRRIIRKLRSARQMEMRKQKKNLKSLLKVKKAQPKNKSTRTKARNKPKEKIMKAEEGIQTGSESKMLSPLLVGTNATLQDELPNDNKQSCLEVTPEMIYEALRFFSKWKHITPIGPILNYIKSNYPVNTNVEELTEELECKLAITTIIGITSQTETLNVKYWCLETRLLRRGLRRNHVSLFWKVYGDTMSPIRKRVPPAPPQEPPKNEGTSTGPRFCHRNEPDNRKVNPGHFFKEDRQNGSLGSHQPYSRGSISQQTSLFLPPIEFQQQTKLYRITKMGYNTRIFGYSPLQSLPNRKSLQGKRKLSGIAKQRKIVPQQQKRQVIRGILKRQPQLRRIRRKNVTENHMKLKTVLDFHHRDSLQVIRKRQNPRQTGSETFQREEIQDSFDRMKGLQIIRKSQKGIHICDSVELQKKLINREVHETNNVSSSEIKHSRDTVIQKEKDDVIKRSDCVAHSGDGVNVLFH